MPKHTNLKAPLNQARDRLFLLAGEVAREPWKGPHVDEIACISFGVTLEFAVEVFDLLVDLDEKLQVQALKANEAGRSERLTPGFELFYGGGTGEVRDIVCMGPPFTISETQIDQVVERLSDAVNAAVCI